MLIKQMSSLIPRNLSLLTSGELLIVFSAKVNLLLPPLFNSAEVLSSASDKAKLFAKNVSMNSNIYDSDISLPVFPSRTNVLSRCVSHRARMSGEYDSRKDSQSTKFERRP